MNEAMKTQLLLHLSAMAFHRNEWAIGWLERIDKAEDKDAVWVEFQEEVRTIISAFDVAVDEIRATFRRAAEGLIAEFAKESR